VRGRGRGRLNRSCKYPDNKWNKKHFIRKIKSSKNNR
jgi:hypothetical protein